MTHLEKGVKGISCVKQEKVTRDEFETGLVGLIKILDRLGGQTAGLYLSLLGELCGVAALLVEKGLVTRGEYEAAKVRGLAQLDQEYATGEGE